MPTKALLPKVVAHACVTARISGWPLSCVHGTLRDKFGVKGAVADRNGEACSHRQHRGEGR